MYNINLQKLSLLSSSLLLVCLSTAQADNKPSLMQHNREVTIAAFADVPLISIKAASLSHQAIINHKQQAGVNDFVINAKSSVYVNIDHKEIKSHDLAAPHSVYGGKVNLKSLLLGGEYNLSDRHSLGASGSLGKGESAGRESAQGLGNDFNFYTLDLYYTYRHQNLSLTLDSSYTKHKNDVSVVHSQKLYSATPLIKTVNVAIESQYDINFENFSLSPYLGLSYIHLDQNDYDVSEDGKLWSHTNTFDQNIFTVPVGLRAVLSTKLRNDLLLSATSDIGLIYNRGELESKNSSFYYNEMKDIEANTTIIDKYIFALSLGLKASYQLFTTQIQGNYQYSKHMSDLGANVTLDYKF